MSVETKPTSLSLSSFIANYAMNSIHCAVTQNTKITRTRARVLKQKKLAIPKRGNINSRLTVSNLVSDCKHRSGSKLQTRRRSQYLFGLHRPPPLKAEQTLGTRLVKCVTLVSRVHNGEL